MKLNRIFDLNFLLIFLIMLLTIIGVVGLYSAAEGNFYPWAIRHLIRFCVFFIIMIALALIDIKIIFKFSYYIFFICLALLISVEIIGSFGKGAERWIRIFGVSIQPSEIIKVGLIIALAKYYHNIKHDNIGNLRNLLIPAFFIFLPFALVVAQPDLGTALSIFLLGVLIMFASGVRIWKFVSGTIIGIVSIPFLLNYLEPYQQKRIFSFLNPESDPLGQGYQLIQSKIALGSGGLFGKGFLQGTQSYLEYLPEKQTDFIFTLIGEEFGFLGTLFIIIIYFLIILICFYISIKSYHFFGRIISVGIASNLFLYVLLNVSMITGLMPVVGIPLPLLSYGGTAMLSIMVSFGLLLNIDLNYNLKKIID
ncbi:rod shape-determining protein RodA [Alphaproteobacteria bacterium]|nr:rod shape-determining protein RodA [Alphaproteobacteria bacterium]